MSIENLRAVEHEAHDRLRRLTVAMDDLVHEEVEQRRKVDETLSSEDEVAYSLHREKLKRVQEQITYTRQSTGIARAAASNSTNNLTAAISERTGQRRVQLIAQLKEQRPGELQDLFDAARIVLIHTSLVDGNDISVLSLDRILGAAYGRYADDFTDEKRKLLLSLEDD